MQTTLRLDDELFRRAKTQAAAKAARTVLDTCRASSAGRLAWPARGPSIQDCDEDEASDRKDEERDDHGAHGVDPVRREQWVNEARAEDHEHGQDAKADRDARGYEQRELA